MVALYDIWHQKGLDMFLQSWVQMGPNGQCLLYINSIDQRQTVLHDNTSNLVMINFKLKLKTYVRCQ